MSLRSLQDMEELPASLQPEAVLTGSPYGAPAPPSIPPGHRLLTGPAYASCNELIESFAYFPESGLEELLGIRAFCWMKMVTIGAKFHDLSPK